MIVSSSELINFILTSENLTRLYHRGRKIKVKDSIISIININRRNCTSPKQTFH